MSDDNEPQELPGLAEGEVLTIGGVHDGIGWLNISDQGVSATFHFVDADNALDVAQRIIGVARAMQLQQTATPTEQDPEGTR